MRIDSRKNSKEAYRPFFSIVIPVYNTQKWLNRCIQSVLSQIYDSFEIILVDDGSTDNCPVICDEYASTCDKIKVIHQKNKGLLQARREGIKKTRGQYILHVDSDDFVSSDLLQSLQYYINRYNADLLVYGYDLVDGEGNKIDNGYYAIKEECRVFTTREFIELNFEHYHLNGIVFKCAKSEIVDRDYDYAQYHKLNMGEDALQSTALVENAKCILYINKVLYHYRLNSESISNKFMSQYIFDFLSVRKRVLEMIYNCDLYHELSLVFYQNYLHDFNRYIMKCLLECGSGNEYRKFRKDVLAKELTLPNRLKLRINEKIIYKVCKLKIVYAFKSIIYRLYMKKKVRKQGGGL